MGCSLRFEISAGLFVRPRAHGSTFLGLYSCALVAFRSRISSTMKESQYDIYIYIKRSIKVTNQYTRNQAVTDYIV